MTNKLQIMVSDFNKVHNKILQRYSRSLDLSSEVGEVCKLAFLESVEQPQNQLLWEEELGDTLYSLLSLINETGLDAEVALKKVIAKYEVRFKSKNSMGS